MVWHETAKPSRLAPERSSSGSQPASDRFPFSPYQRCNALKRRTGRFQLCGFLIARLPTRVGILAALLGRCRFGGPGWGDGYTIRWRAGYAGRRHGRLFGDLLGDLPNLKTLTIDDDPNGITEVAQQVPTVSYLNRVWRRLANTVGIGAGAVACDNLDTGVLAKPRG